MPTIAEVRQKFPQYNDMSDAELASALHKKFYSDMPESEFATKIGLAQSAPSPPAKGSADRWSAADEAVAGATFGMSIPLAAAGMTPIEMLAQRTLNPIDAYRNARNRMDADRAAYGADNPIKSVIGNAVGGLATGGLAAKSGATLLGRFGPGPAARVGEAAAEGSIYGGLTGAGEARGSIDDQLGDVAKGAAIGGVLGGGLAGASQLSGALGSGLRSAIKGARDPEGYAAQKVVQAIQRDGSTVADTLKVGDSSPDTMLADMGGENVRRLLRASGNVSGPAANDIAEAMGERLSGQRGRMMDAVSKNLAPGNAVSRNLGPGDMYHATLDEIAATYRTKADPLYKAAYAKPVDYTTFELDRLMPRIPKQAWGDANKLMQIEGYKPKQLIANIEDDGSVTLNRVPDMRQWDYVKRGLDSMIAAEDGKGAMGGTTPVGRALSSLKNEILQVLDKQNPQYAGARRFSSDMIGLKKAADLGTEILQMPKGDAVRAFSALSQAEKNVARIGLAKTLKDKILAGSDGSDRVKAVWNEKTREILKETFDQKAFRNFARFMESEKIKMTTLAAARGNSTTAQQLASLLDAGDSAAIDTIKEMAKGNLWGATLSAVARWARKMGGLNENSAASMAKILTTQKAGIDKIKPKLLNAESAMQNASNRAVNIYPAFPRTAGMLGASYASRPTDDRQ